MKTVVKNEGDKVPVEVLAESIVAISAGIKKITDGPLNERAIHLLIKDSASLPLSFRQIKAVIDGMKSLEATYLKKKK